MGICLLFGQEKRRGDEDKDKDEVEDDSDEEDDDIYNDQHD